MFVVVVESHESTVWSICFEAGGKRLASVSDDKTLKIWREYPPGNPQGMTSLSASGVLLCVVSQPGLCSNESHFCV